MTRVGTIRILCCCYVTLFFAPQSQADHFTPLDTIQSMHGIYYTTMAPYEHYLAMGDQRSPGAAVDIIDVSIPSNMTLAATIQTNHMTYELAWDGNYIYCPASWDGLFIYDVSNFNNIVQAYDSSFGTPMTSVIIRDHVALVGSVNGLYAFDVSNPYYPVITSHQSDIVYFNAAEGDTVIYAFETYEYVNFIGISNPQRPYLISTLACPDIMGLDVDEARNLMFVVTQSRVVKVYNIADLLHPVILGSINLPSGAWGIDVDFSVSQPGVIIVSGYTRGIFAINVSDPTAPVISASWPTPQQSNYVLIDKSIVYNTGPDFLYSLAFDNSNLSIDDDLTIPQKPELSQNYPNPFNPTTTITFTLPSDDFTVIDIYNSLGQKVTTLLSAYESAGPHQVEWNAGDNASGQYYYSITSGKFEDSRKMMLVK